MSAVLDASGCAGVECVPGGHVEYAAGAAWQAWLYDGRGVLVSVRSFESYGALRAWLDEMREGVKG